MQRNLPTVSGFNKVYANMGETANKGIELTLNSRNIVTKDFTWSTNLVFLGIRMKSRICMVTER